MKILEGQQIGYNSIFNHYLFIGIEFLALFGFSGLLDYFLEEKLNSWIYWPIKVLLIITIFVIILKEAYKKKGQLKYFLFSDNIIDNNKKEIPFSIFTYALLTNDTCIIITKTKKYQLKFKVYKNVDKNELLELINNKIKSFQESDFMDNLIEEYKLKESFDKIE